MSYILKIDHEKRKEMGLTIGQFSIADAIQNYFKGENKASIESISEYLDIHTDHVRSMLQILENSGLIKVSSRGNISSTKEWKEAVKPEKKEKPVSKIISMIRQEVEKRNVDYYWTAADGHAAKLLSNKMTFAITQKQDFCNDDLLFKMFCLILDTLPQWWADKWDLTKINSNYNSIISQIKSDRAKREQSDRGVGSDHWRKSVEHFVASKEG